MIEEKTYCDSHNFENYRSKAPSVFGGYEYIRICKDCGFVEHNGCDCYCFFCNGYDHSKYSKAWEVLEKI